MAVFSVRLQEIIDQFHLVPVSEAERAGEIKITTSDVNRPGLQLSGFLDYFGNDRIQIMGMAEMAYLRNLSAGERESALDRIFTRQFPCMVVARQLEIFPEMLTASRRYHIPILSTDDITSAFMSGLIRYLNVHLAPRVTTHGVLVEVYGEGILIQGESGVGKSETALEIVKRGHRLIADDLVEIRRVSDTTLLGKAPDIIRHFIEIRGIGLLDVKNLYGVGSVKIQENVNLVINLEIWDRAKNYERIGITEEYTDILGIKVPSHTIPVRPGRNLAIIVEVAAMNYRQKEMGYNAAQTLVERAMGQGDGAAPLDLDDSGAFGLDDDEAFGLDDGE
ncbi:MAG: HPr(Ser) kinase/phosphatase [Clostridiales bacterium]|jgi:HPr kinase/phosphorylase|nr:HPr(Ser) kinase/phosphatase [Clostridiales bacterium]